MSVSAATPLNVRLSPDLTAPALARRLVRAVLTEWGLPALVDDACLVTSEIVTNSVIHAGGDLRLRVDLTDAALLVEVHDGSTEIPTLFDAGAQDENHRGILIIDEVAVDWGYTITADGKCVHARFTRG
jgi:anti-sigma regulatory factor (Ser/Thr protein kinase)